MNFPKVSIIILNWNGLSDTMECLDSLKKNLYPNYDIYLVDNGSRSNDADILEKKYNKYIKIIRNKENLGFTGGNNVGINFALKQEIQPDYIFLLNNDVKIREDCLVNLVKSAVRIDAGIVGAGEKSDIFPEGKLYFGGNPMGKFALVDYFFSRTPMMLQESDAVLESNCVSGASMLIRRDVLQDVYNLTNNYLNEKIFMYYDELDFCNAARKLGYKSFSVQNAVIYHKGSSSTGGAHNPIAYYYTVRNSLLVSKKFFSFPIRQLVFLYIFLFNFARFIKNLINRRFHSCQAILYGLRDGVIGIGGKWRYHEAVSAARKK